MPSSPPHFKLAWHDEYGYNGITPRMSLARAEAIARDFDRPRAWAAIIDTQMYTFVRQYGTPREELLRQAQRKPAASETAPAKARRAAG